MGQRSGWWKAAAVCGLTSMAASGVVHAQQVDHAAFDELLRRNVNGRGLVDYDAFARSPAFEAYLKQLARTVPRSLPEADRLAFWINAYNAYTIALINKHDERKSIRNINRTLGFIRAKGPWSERIAVIGGEAYTLDEIEHEIIRKRFKEPRIHFALVCAALGCPPLRQEAYVGPTLNEQLDDQARVFLRESPEKNRIDVASGVVTLSRIFDWYGSDFGASAAEIGRNLSGYFKGAERDLLASGNFRLRFSEYDWSLNTWSR